MLKICLTVRRIRPTELKIRLMVLKICLTVRKICLTVPKIRCMERYSEGMWYIMD